MNADNPPHRLWPLFAILLGCALVPATAADGPQLPEAVPGTVDFRRDIYPLLSARCFKCHQAADASSGHRLDLRAELLGEGNGRPMVEVGNSARSRLIHLVAGALPGKVMPLKGERLTAREVGLLRAWIDQGLKWDET